jgi:methylenetetrahydrofolate--tRNA-(uracil-5-)-methyltransferase
MMIGGDSMHSLKATVVGAGLAGVEAAWQLAKRGVSVDLYEMKKHQKSPAHSMETFAELVCSNSLRSDSLQNAVGILKEELRRMDSIVMKAADLSRVPAGSALAVDRIAFSDTLTGWIKAHPLITVIDEEVTDVPAAPVILATGPLTSARLYDSLRAFTGHEYLYFFDAAAPIVELDSINLDVAYFKSRYDKGEATYLNCPMTKDEYDRWYEEVIHAECVVPKDFEMKVFEGCMPFEEMAKRGKETLLYGPMKPVGLRTPQDERPYAVVQLRQDNLIGTLYNLVGFQTHLTFPEQKRILRMIPGLERVEIVRYGVMHRNSFVNAPALLDATYQMKNHPGIYIAGQLSGVEGYVESVGSGLVAGISLARRLRDREAVLFPVESAIGAQAHYIANAEPSLFQPMNINFGIFPLLDGPSSKTDRKRHYGERALSKIEMWKERGFLD